MRPLSSPVDDHRTLGRAEVIIGCAFLIVAGGLSPADAFIGVFIVTPLLTASLYLGVFRRVTRTAVRHAPPAPPGELRPHGAYLRRLRVPLALQVLVFVFFTATARAPGLLGGIALGVGLAFLLTARWLEGWENANQAGLLREVRGLGRGEDGTRAPGGYYVAGGRKTRLAADAKRA
jgi:hypothetical protein